MRRLKLTFLVLAAAVLAAGSPARAEEAAGPKFTYPFDWKKLVGTDEWGGLYMAGKKCGWMHSTIKLETRDGKEILIYRAEMRMQMKYQGITAEAGSDSRHEFSAETGELLAIESRMTTGPLITNTRVVPDGEFFRCTLTAGNKPVESKIPRCKYNLEAVLAAQELAAKPDAQAGDKLVVEMLLPETGGAVRVESTVKGRKTVVFRGVPTEVTEIAEAIYKLPPAGEPPPENPAPLAVSLVKVDGSGRMLEGQLLGPFSFRMESQADAKRMDVVSDVMLNTAVQLDKPIANSRGAKEAVLKITGMPEDSQINDRRQKFEKQADGSWLLTLKTDAVAAKRGALSDDEKKKLAACLSPTAFLQSEDPKIKRLAADTVGEEQDPYQAAGLLCDWVFKNIRKEFTPALSNALDTLSTRKGDCGEHTALFVALCRAAGVPAREVAGLAYAPAGAGGSLGGHAWGEVYVGGEWVAMDPTFGERLADALHLKIAEGGMSGVDGLIRLADLLGKLKVEVVSVK